MVTAGNKGTILAGIIREHRDIKDTMRNQDIYGEIKSKNKAGY